MEMGPEMEMGLGMEMEMGLEMEREAGKEGPAHLTNSTQSYTTSTKKPSPNGGNKGQDIT